MVGALLPEGAIVVDEALTSGVGPARADRRARRRTTGSCLTGGAIGYGLPTAPGAAIACPGRPVIGLQADGSAMYTISALWSYAREQARRHDDRLRQRLVRDPAARTVAGRGRPATVSGRGQLLDLGGPASTSSPWRHGMGVPATRATTAEELADQLAHARWPSPART